MHRGRVPYRTSVSIQPTSNILLDSQSITTGTYKTSEKIYRQNDIPASYVIRDSSEDGIVDETRLINFHTKEEKKSDEHEFIYENYKSGDTTYWKYEEFEKEKSLISATISIFDNGFIMDYYEPSQKDDGWHKGHDEYIFQNDSLVMTETDLEDGMDEPYVPEIRIYVPEKDNPSSCQIWRKNIDYRDTSLVLKGILTVTEIENGIKVTEKTEGGFRTKEYFMIYAGTEGTPQSISRRTAQQRRISPNKGLHDLKGRKINKRLPYRVVF